MTTLDCNSCRLVMILIECTFCCGPRNPKLQWWQDQTLCAALLGIWTNCLITAKQILFSSSESWTLNGHLQRDRISLLALREVGWIILRRKLKDHTPPYKFHHISWGRANCDDWGGEGISDVQFEYFLLTEKIDFSCLILIASIWQIWNFCYLNHYYRNY